MSHTMPSRRLRITVSAIALLSLNVQPVLAQGRGGDPALNVCATQRAPLVKLDSDYKELKRSKMSQAIGEGLKTGATVLAKGVVSGGIPVPGGSRFGGGLGGGLGGLMGAAAAGMGTRQAQAGAAPQAATGLAFGQDLLTGAAGLNVPGLGGFGGSGDAKGYAALAVLVAIVATADAYARLKEQEAGGDLRKASFNIDQDAGRQRAVSREIVDSGNALVECRSRQLEDINTRLAGASNDKDRKAITRERTELNSALRKDIDLTGGVVEQHTGMAKTFTQGRAMTDGTSEADVLGGQAPAYAPAAATTRLAMPAKSGGNSMAPPQMQAQAQAPAAPAPSLVALRATVVRSAPVASADVLMNFPVGREVKPKTSQADGGWWEIDVAGQSGYIRAADLGPPGSAPVQVASAAPVKGKAGAKAPAQAAPPPPPPAVEGPSNIRAYNQTVIAARDQGKGRLSSLMTDIQTSQRKESVLWAMLSRLNLG